MRKTLLIACLAALATTGFAQKPMQVMHNMRTAATTGKARTAQIKAPLNVVKPNNVAMENTMSLDSKVRTENNEASAAKKAAPFKAWYNDPTAYSKGNYYSHPEGTMYKGWGYRPTYDPATGTYGAMGSFFSRLLWPFPKTVTFKQGGGQTNFYWKQGGYSYSEYGAIDLPFGDFGFAMRDAWAPQIVSGTDSFSIGSNSLNGFGVTYRLEGYGFEQYYEYDQIRSEIIWGAGGSDSIGMMYPVDDHGYYMQHVSSTNYFLRGNNFNYSETTSNHYLWGSGIKTIPASQLGTEDDVQAVMHTIRQYMGYTLGPLYVEDMVVKGITNNLDSAGNTHIAKPITGNGRLRMRIVKCTYDDRYNEWTPSISPSNLIATLYATANDTVFWRDLGYYADKPYMYGYLVFSQRGQDEFGSEVAQPFVIPEGEHWGVIIDGFATDNNTKVNPDVSFGPSGLRIPDEDNTQIGSYQAKYIGRNGNPTMVYGDGNTDAQGRSMNLAVNVGVEGMYDGISVPENMNYMLFEQANENNSDVHFNAVRFPNNGGYGVTDGCNDYFYNKSATQISDYDHTGVPGAMVYTTTYAWDPTETTFFYDVNDAPAWITQNGMEELTQVGYDYEGNETTLHSYTYVYEPMAAALPSGVNSRWAAVHFNSTRGATSDPIFLLQGNITYEQAKAEYEAQQANGVSSLKADTDKKADEHIFNLAGQEVNKNYKGFVVTKGKKTLQK